MSYIVVHRKRKNRVKLHPFIKFYPKHGYFTFSYKAAEILKVNSGDGVMFGFNFKEKRAYVFKDNSKDAFTLNKVSGRNLLKFGSIDLRDYFLQCFNFDHSDDIYRFNLIISSTNKKKYELQYQP